MPCCNVLNCKLGFQIFFKPFIGVLAFMNGGDRIDAGVMVVPAINALQGNYEGPVYLYPNYVQMHSSEDMDDFFQYVENTEIPPFTADELRAWMK